MQLDTIFYYVPIITHLLILFPSIHIGKQFHYFGLSFPHFFLHI